MTARCIACAERPVYPDWSTTLCKRCHAVWIRPRRVFVAYERWLATRARLFERRRCRAKLAKMTTAEFARAWLKTKRKAGGR